MDINVAFRLARGGYRSAAKDALDWLRKGGYPPDGWSRYDAINHLKTILREAEYA